MASFTTDLTEREHYFSSMQPDIKVPRTFIHTPADNRPVPPDFPGELDETALEEVNAWKQDGAKTEAESAAYPEDGDAITYAEAFIDYSAAIRAWLLADAEARKAQYRWLLADAAVLNKPTLSVTADDTGTGGDPPPEDIPPQPVQGDPP